MSSTSPTSTTGVSTCSPECPILTRCSRDRRARSGFREPVQMCFENDGRAFLVTEGVVLALKDGVFRYVAGTPGLPGYRDGSAAEALLGRQLSICPDGRGGFYIGDRSNRCLRRLRRGGPGWVIETVAGDPASRPHRNNWTVFVMKARWRRRRTMM